jgi:hypothetical protein
MMKSRSLPLYLLIHVAAISWSSCGCCFVLAYGTSSSFHGRSLALEKAPSVRYHHVSSSSMLTMRKQKASDKRTTRLQRGEGLSTYDDTAVIHSLEKTLTSSPMADAVWKEKVIRNQFQGKQVEKSGGRGRSRKRSALYHCLSNYHEQFLTLLTAEYKAEVSVSYVGCRVFASFFIDSVYMLPLPVDWFTWIFGVPSTHPCTHSFTFFSFQEDEVLGRIKASLEDPISLEKAGHALFDMYPERRGNLFGDEVGLQLQFFFVTLDIGVHILTMFQRETL